jgi:hypothetical protein
MSGGKGGSQTSQVQVPDWVKEPAQRNLARGEYAANLGYTPYYGADVAAMSPMQQASMQNTGQAAQAFGMASPADPMAGMPQAQNFGGVQGYSSGGLFDQALGELQARRPGQFDALNGMFIDPQTGKMDVGFTTQGPVATSNAPQVVQDLSSGVVDANTGAVSGMTPGHLLQGLADAPGLLSLVPGLGMAKMAAQNYVNNQARQKNSPYMNTDRGFSDNGGTYTSTWGQDYNTAGMSDATKRGLDIASSQSYDPYGYGD